MKIRPATTADFETITGWLAAARLPVADLSIDDMRDFLLAESGGVPVGTVGLEPFDDIGLLRSLVVVPHSQGSGAGRRLVAALEREAAARGMSELWLLTTDADAYFMKLGYDVMPRESAPERIQRTTEFSKLCPSDAILMRRRL
jgi:amino-acid N-acetyltransferase